MTDRIIDLKKQLRELKAGEKMAAFAGFSLDLGEPLGTKDGVLKIADFIRPDGSGYLTVTFQLDLGPDLAEHRAVAQAFQRLSAFASRADHVLGRARFGKGFDYMLCMDQGLSEGEVWYTAEADIYYTGLRGRVRELVTQAVLPGLAAIVPVTFEAANWWDDGQG
ncbi:hypothetical protein ASZ90_002291 [hydrocarbon metagenome]|uniref:Uncharacterized protein n=1 Tax=hydrocarbon metagenome TaxID=938273 RepID=A0A0W8G432_9ZZZZ